MNVISDLDLAMALCATGLRLRQDEDLGRFVARCLDTKILI